MEAKLFEFLVIVLGGLVITQIILPVLINRPLFFMFRRSKLSEEKAALLLRNREAREQLRLAGLRAETIRLEVKAEVIRNSALDEELAELENVEDEKKGKFHE